MSAFKVGDTVRARESVQGMAKGAQYRVADVRHNNTAWGNFVTYLLTGDVAGTPWLPIANGHLLLERVEAPTPEQSGVKLAALLALEGLLQWRDNMSEDEDGYPASEPTCRECTRGTTPDRSNRGLCAWHEAERVVREAQKGGAR